VKMLGVVACLFVLGTALRHTLGARRPEDLAA
jgi:hypothetical protein